MIYQDVIPGIIPPIRMSTYVGMRAWSKEVPQYIRQLYVVTGNEKYADDLKTIRHAFIHGFQEESEKSLLRKYAIMMYEHELEKYT